MNAMTFIAQATASQWGGFQTVVLVVLCPLITALATLAMVIIRDRKREVGPQPFVIAMQKEFASQTEFHRHVQENQRQHEQFDVRIGGVDRKGKEKLEERIEAMRREREEGQTRMHDQMNVLSIKVGQLETETKNQTQQLNRIDQKIDQINRKT